MFRSGYVAIVGRPNMGKSTLLNQIIGEKITIVSDKAQTTRNTIPLIYTDEESQIIFLDTPGIQSPKNKLGEYLLEVSASSLNEADFVTYIVDCSEKIGRLDTMILEMLQKVRVPIFLIINKIDLILNELDLIKIKEMYEKYQLFERIFFVSALNNEGVDEYLSHLKGILPEGPMFYPDDMITDKTERFVVSEIIREKVLLNMDEEIPHGIAVAVEEMKERAEKNIMDVSAVIYCEKDSHKGMVIGKGGNMLKRIGSEARRDIESLLDCKVYLKLWVKVEKNWREKENKVKSFGYKR